MPPTTNETEALLKKVESLNKARKYDDVISLLPDAVLQSHGSADLYAEKAQALYLTKQYDQSGVAVDKALAIDSKHAKANHYKGNWHFNRKENTEAIAAYQMALLQKPKYATPYNGLGNVYKRLKRYDDALQAYDDAIRLDKGFAAAYYNRANAYYEIDQYEEALKDYEKRIELNKNLTDEFTEVAKQRVETLKKLLKDKEYDEIKKVVLQIKKVLLHEDGKITHYTSLKTAKELILKKSPLRLSEGAFLNDSSEGLALFEYLLPTDPGKPTVVTQPEPFAQKPFIGSYVPGSLHDDLTLWRMYGKDDKEEAKGCSITLDAGELLHRIKQLVVKPGDGAATAEAEEDFNFYRVAYRPVDSTGKFVIPGDDDHKKEEDLNNHLKTLKERVGEFYKKNDASGIKFVLEQLNSIAYLFKNSAYQYEHELRLVVKGARFRKKIENSFTPPWVYIELVDILPLIRQITLGPKVDKKDEWKSAFYYGITQELTEDDFPPDIYVSYLPFK